LVRADAREHAQMLIFRLRGLHYEQALLEARQYIDKVLACEKGPSSRRFNAGEVPRSVSARAASSTFQLKLTRQG
jgi:hypothetical protein